METISPPDHPELSPARAFALTIETACEQFEVFHLIKTNEIKIEMEKQQIDVRKRLTTTRAPYCIQMALAKSFVANTIRARRICEHGARHLSVSRTERQLFLKSTEPLLLVRDVNEHGFDINNGKSKPSFHFKDGAFSTKPPCFPGVPIGYLWDQ